MAFHLVLKLTCLSLLVSVMSCNEKDAPPALSLFSMDTHQGSSEGGEMIRFTGAGLQYLSRVYFGDRPCQNLSVSDSSAVCLTPPHPAGEVVVTGVNTIGHQSSLSTLFTFNDPPVIESIHPDSGPDIGGVEVSIIGENFRPGAQVAVNRAPCINVVVIDSYRITCETTASNPGLGPVSIENADGTEVVEFDFFTVF